MAALLCHHETVLIVSAEERQHVGVDSSLLQPDITKYWQVLQHYLTVRGRQQLATYQ